MMRRLPPAACGIVALILMLPTSCRERGQPDPNIRMVPSHQPTDDGSGTSGATVPSRLVVPEAVSEAFSGVRLSWTDRGAGAGGGGGSLEVPLGSSATIPGSNLDVRADAYLPAFAMNADVITSQGIEEGNPAARIAVLENGREIFAGWIFQKFPDVHPFSHERYGLRLEGGVRSARK